MRANVPGNWYGTEARAPERPVWVHAAAVAFGKHFNRDVTATLFDITKAFDHIRWSHLIKAARKRGFPDDLLALLYRLHSATRRVIVDGFVVDEVDPSISVVAGCAHADQLMLLMMMDVDEDVRGAEPDVMTAVVADDYQLLAISDPKPIQLDGDTDIAGGGVLAKSSVEKMVTAVNATLAAFRAKHLPVAQDKLVGLATAKKLETEITDKIPQLSKSFTSTTRNLGADFTMRGMRRTPTFNARFRKTKKRAGNAHTAPWRLLVSQPMITRRRKSTTNEHAAVGMQDANTGRSVTRRRSGILSSSKKG
jgi:hypothetical protein